MLRERLSTELQRVTSTRRGVLLAVFGLIVAELAFGFSGWFAAATLIVALLVIPGRRVFVFALLAALLIARLVVARPDARYAVEVWPSGETRWLNQAFDESDAALLGALAISAAGYFGEDVGAFRSALSSGYERMRADVGYVATPNISTYLSRQRPTAFDTIVLGPRDPEFVAVFLHGFAGNLALLCWQVSLAVEDAGGATVCPSTAWHGRWWDDAATARAAIGEAQRRYDVDQVVLVGLSNGAVGASRLAADLQDELSALILISGGAGNAPRPEALPVFGVTGTDDPMTPGLIQFVERASGGVVEVPGGHFVLLEERGRVRRAIAEWLKREKRASD